MTVNEALSLEYPALCIAANKISGGELSMDLLHYAIEEFLYKPNALEIAQSGGIRFYIVRIMMTQSKSVTGPFYKQNTERLVDKKEDNFYDTEFIDHSTEQQPEPFDYKKAELLLSKIETYDATLFKMFVDEDHNYSSLSRSTGIPRTSISLTIRRVKQYLKKNL